MWGPSFSPPPAPLNPKFREHYTCVFGPNGPEFALVPQQLSAAAIWEGPSRVPQAPAKAASIVEVGGPACWERAPSCGSAGGALPPTLSPQTSTCSSSSCASEFGMGLSVNAEGGALGGAPLGVPASEIEEGEGPLLCGGKRRLRLEEGPPRLKHQRVCGV